MREQSRVLAYDLAWARRCALEESALGAHFSFKASARRFASGQKARKKPTNERTMKAIKQSTARLTAGCIFALGLVINLGAQDTKSEQPLIPGTYYSAKDFGFGPPFPFNPHPELETVEVEPGIFLIDDTVIPDTPEQAAARATRNAAVERAKAIASDPILAEAARAAQQAAREAAWAKNWEEIAPWLVSPLPPSDGRPASRQNIEAETQSKLLTLADQFSAQNEALLQAATNVGTPTEMVFPNGERAVLAGFEGGQPVWNMSDGITQAVSIATASVWPGGGAGFSLTGTNTPVGQWEAAGIPRLTHAEFQGRVSVKDGTTNAESHATAVASVLNGAGLYNIEYPAGVINYQAAKGMSYAAPVFSHNASNDVSEMASQVATNAFKISNHSYSIRCGWQYGGAWFWFGDSNVS